MKARGQVAPEPKLNHGNPCRDPADVGPHQMQVAGCQFGPSVREVGVGIDRVACPGPPVDHEPQKGWLGREHLPAESLGTRPEQHDGRNREVHEKVHDDERPDQPVPRRPVSGQVMPPSGRTDQ